MRIVHVCLYVFFFLCAWALATLKSFAAKRTRAGSVVIFHCPQKTKRLMSAELIRAFVAQTHQTDYQGGATGLETPCSPMPTRAQTRTSEAAWPPPKKLRCVTVSEVARAVLASSEAKPLARSRGAELGDGGEDRATSFHRSGRRSAAAMPVPIGSSSRRASPPVLRARSPRWLRGRPRWPSLAAWVLVLSLALIWLTLPFADLLVTVESAIDKSTAISNTLRAMDGRSHYLGPDGASIENEVRETPSTGCEQGGEWEVNNFRADASEMGLLGEEIENPENRGANGGFHTAWAPQRPPREI